MIHYPMVRILLCNDLNNEVRGFIKPASLIPQAVVRPRSLITARSGSRSRGRSKPLMLRSGGLTPPKGA